jgi:quercetin 2,3-dioxygenase
MRTIKIITTKITMEGAGVKLQRIFGPELNCDPFLLMDHFGSDNPNDYMRGFPSHPHRGIETVTYMLEGEVSHSDSIGNKGTIKPGEVQWMAAGSGIIHSEMPLPCEGEMQGFQLWINLSRKRKMTPPQYKEIKDLVMVERPGAKIKIIAGELDGQRGGMNLDVEYFDVNLSGTFSHKTKNRTVLIYVITGSIELMNKHVPKYHCALLKGDGEIVVKSEGARFLAISGEPLNESIAWAGPIVMNTQEELDLAFDELDKGTFIK